MIDEPGASVNMLIAISFQHEREYRAAARRRDYGQMARFEDLIDSTLARAIAIRKRDDAAKRIYGGGNKA